jgi:hypothetical protein
MGKTSQDLPHVVLLYRSSPADLMGHADHAEIWQVGVRPRHPSPAPAAAALERLISRRTYRKVFEGSDADCETIAMVLIRNGLRVLIRNCPRTGRMIPRMWGMGDGEFGNRSNLGVTRAVAEEGA